MAQLLKEVMGLDPRGKAPYLEIPTGGDGTLYGIEMLTKMPPNEAPTLTRTHLQYEFLRDKVENEGLKTVVVLRNPKDILVSSYHMYRTQDMLNHFPGTFSQWFKLYEAKKLVYGDPIDWMASWWAAKDLPNVRIFTYEEMKADCADVVRRLAGFLGKHIDESRVQDIVRDSSFGAMQSRKEFPEFKAADGSMKMNMDSFFRKGVVGDWKNHFNEKQAKKVDKLTAKLLTPLGINFDVNRSIMRTEE
jgi:hypothetical protein